MNHPEYLIRHGLLGDIGRFRAGTPLALSRGQRVVIRGPRGTEIGEVVRSAGLSGPGFGGDLLRATTSEDESRQAQLTRRAGALAAEANKLADSLGMAAEFLDGEIQLDTQHASLLHVCLASTDLSSLRRQLEQQTGLFIALVNLTRQPEPASSCGSCGGGGCGDGDCSSGGCGSGSCGSARPDEVQAYFADLRKQSERRMTLL